MKIIPSHNIMEYFMEAFDSAKKKTHLNISQETEFYIVDMLSEFSDAEKFLECYTDEPFAIMLKRAQENENERFMLSKKIGDLSGYMCGFFPEKLRTSGNDIRYYISIGKSGYKMASRLSLKRKGIFDEMAQKLPAIVDTLNEIKESRDVVTNTDILEIYQRWLDTGSERLRKMLFEKGLIPIEGPGFFQ
ncbi:MAG: hypothetical protein QW286_02870 [Candidatus Aenigmatarchaeota archaeon]